MDGLKQLGLGRKEETREEEEQKHAGEAKIEE